MEGWSGNHSLTQLNSSPHSSKEEKIENQRHDENEEEEDHHDEEEEEEEEDDDDEDIVPDPDTVVEYDVDIDRGGREVENYFIILKKVDLNVRRKNQKKL